MPSEETTRGALRSAAQGLRFRLTASYVLLFALVLTSVGLMFRQTLTVTLGMQNDRVLAEEWSLLRGYLRVQDGELAWVYRPDEAEEAYAVEKLRRVLMLAETNGDVLEISNGYAALGPETRDQIRKALNSREPLTVTRRDSRGDTYLVRMGALRDEGKEYFVALGLSVEETLGLPGRILRVYFLTMPVMLLAIGVLGWFAADRALRPLQEVTSATRQVAGGNLSLRIPPRATGDELDGLINTFNGMMGRLEQNFERMRRFSTDASHELRTPLTVIRGQLEVALLTAESPAQFKSAIETALQDVERLVAIVNGLLQLAEAESGQVRLRLAPQDATDVVKDSLSRVSAAIAAKGISLELDAAGPCNARIDREMFSRLADQMISNAVKFTPAGGAVKVRLWRDADWAWLQVVDNGPGIGEEHLPHVFERFYRVRAGEPGQAPGAGLGLTMAAWIAEAHGGRIAVRSTLGQGATFEVCVPAAGHPAAMPEPARKAS